VTQLKTPQTIEEKYVKFNLLYKKDWNSHAFFPILEDGWNVDHLLLIVKSFFAALSKSKNKLFHIIGSFCHLPYCQNQIIT
jgi:hypothetical protein